MGKYIQRSGRCSLAQAAVQAVSDLLINELFDDGNWYAYEWPEGMSYVSFLWARRSFHLDSTYSYSYSYTYSTVLYRGDDDRVEACGGSQGSRIREGGSLVGPRVPTMTRYGLLLRYCTKYCTCAQRACTVRVLDENEKKRGSSWKLDHQFPSTHTLPVLPN